MPDRLGLLEKIAASARYIRVLERSLTVAHDAHRVTVSLEATRAELDDLLRELEQIDRAN